MNFILLSGSLSSVCVVLCLNINILIGGEEVKKTSRELCICSEIFSYPGSEFQCFGFGLASRFRQKSDFGKIQRVNSDVLWKIQKVSY